MNEYLTTENDASPERPFLERPETNIITSCLSVLEGEYPTDRKKQALAYICRQRELSYKPVILKYAQHRNPEIVMQAIRGLLCFKQDKEVITFLASLKKHPNDMIRDVVQKELSTTGRQTHQKDHAESIELLRNKIVEGDTLEILDHVQDNSVHLTFTSPPYYNARDYSIYTTYNEYLGLLEQIFKKVHRITKEGRFCVVNSSPVIIPRAGRKYSSRRYPIPFDLHNRLMSMGWEFIDDIIWAKPEKSAKNRVSGFNMNRKPLTYKPNPRTEYLMVYRKKTDKLIDWNLKQYDLQTTTDSLVDDDFERSNVWDIAPTSSKQHSAVFPSRLCDQVIKLYSFKNDLVFDPFAGSGTMGVSALNLGRYFFLTEKCHEYVNAMVNRINEASLPMLNKWEKLSSKDFAMVMSSKP